MIAPLHPSRVCGIGRVAPCRSCEGLRRRIAAKGRSRAGRSVPPVRGSARAAHDEWSIEGGSLRSAGRPRERRDVEGPQVCQAVSSSTATIRRTTPRCTAVSSSTATKRRGTRGSCAVSSSPNVPATGSRASERRGRPSAAAGRRRAPRRPRAPCATWRRTGARAARRTPGAAGARPRPSWILKDVPVTRANRCGPLVGAHDERDDRGRPPRSRGAGPRGRNAMRRTIEGVLGDRAVRVSRGRIADADHRRHHATYLASTEMCLDLTSRYAT
jgi:hypothetical protein